MNQLKTHNTMNESSKSRRYTGFPLNSTLISAYTPDTIRSIINHAASGKPYTTAVWIRVSRSGIQISAQDPQIARTRIPVFIPILLAQDIFMQPNINNVICIVYDEVKSNMKGVLLYVIHPTEAQLLREDFRIVKQTSYSKGIENTEIGDLHATENNRLFSPTSQQSSDTHRNGKTNRQQSPRRILYIRDNQTGINRELTPSSAPPLPISQLSYTPFKSSYHTSREDSGQRRHKSPRKNKTGYSSSKPGSDNGSKHRRKYRSRSPQKQAKPELPLTSNSQDLLPDQINQQQIATWQAAQQAPIIPMGIYNRYVPKAVPLPPGEKTTPNLSPSHINGEMTNGKHEAPEQNGKNNESSRSPSRSPKRNDSRQRSRPVSAHNPEVSGTLIQSSHHHHHHRRHHINGNTYSSSKPNSNMYSTISHSSRTRSKYLPASSNNNNNIDNETETKQYLKQLIDDMQAMKLEMNKIRLTSSSIGGTTRVRSDSLQFSLKELRNDIDTIRTRMGGASSKLTKT